MTTPLTQTSSDRAAPLAGEAGGDSVVNDSSRVTFRRFARQSAVLAWAGLVVFWGFYALDHFRAGAGATGGPGLLSRYFAFDPASVANTVTALEGVNASVFGIVITVVSIIVQLSSARYTGVAHAFLRDRVNIIVAAYFVITCVASVWLSASVNTQYAPMITLTALLAMTTTGLVIMVPYFGYVFWFLEPQNIIRRIREAAVAQVNQGASQPDREKCFVAQAKMLSALEELTDIANSSISGKDKIVASDAVDALKDFAIEYSKSKGTASDAWMSIGPHIKQNPDFVAMDAELRRDLEIRRGWVEWKVMRQFMNIYNESLTSMRDINYLIAIDTRYIGEQACRSKDPELVALVFRFLNSYLRTTLNAKDVRTAYNVLNQYRKLTETLLDQGNHAAALEAVRHMKYYGLVSFGMNLSFVTETVGYDLSSIAQHAHKLKSPLENAILSEFLELDRGPFLLGQEQALIGVRKAQVKLAAYYIECGEETRARAIANDMRFEAKERLRQIYTQLAAVEHKDYWEIIDRGGNFEYMPPELRACLPTFFGWLEIGPQGETA